MGKGKSRRGSPFQMAKKGAAAKSGSRHLRRVEQAKARLEAKGYKFPEAMR